MGGIPQQPHHTPCVINNTDGNDEPGNNDNNDKGSNNDNLLDGDDKDASGEPAMAANAGEDEPEEDSDQGVHRS